MRFKEFYITESVKSFEDIKLAIIADLKKNKSKAIEEEVDWDLIYVLDVFKKHFGKIGAEFSVGMRDKVNIPSGSYKILKYIQTKNNFDIKLKKIGEKNPFKKSLKIDLKAFLRQAGIDK